MTTANDLIEYLNANLYVPVLTSGRASLGSRRRVLTDRNRLPQLPVRSIALYVVHGAGGDTPARSAANEQLEREGLPSYRLLLPDMRERFSDVWPIDS
jgi:hypothetical protein